MLMDHTRAPGRPSWPSTLYSSMAASAPASTSNTGSSLSYDPLRETAFATEPAPYHPQHQPQYPQQDQHYRYPYSDATRPTLDPRSSSFAPFPLPPSSRDDPLGANRLRYPPPSLPRPLTSGPLSPHVRSGVKTSGVSPLVGSQGFSIAKPASNAGPAAPKRASDEERRAKHREAQRRFVKRKKIEMLQLKQLAVELEKRHDLLQAVSEREALARENAVMERQLEDKARQASTPTGSVTTGVSTDASTSTSTDSQPVKLEVDTQVTSAPHKSENRPPIEWEARIFEW